MTEERRVSMRYEWRQGGKFMDEGKAGMDKERMKSRRVGMREK